MRSGPPRESPGRRPPPRGGGRRVAVLLVALLAGGCAEERPDGEASGREAPSDGRAEGADPAVVVVSVPPLAWFVDRLAGERAEVVVMVPPGASPATHEPTSRQMRAVSRADLYVAVGHPAFPFEAVWMEALTAVNPEMEVVRSADRCDVIPDDPHVWLSTACARRMAAAVAAALERTPAVSRSVLEGRRRAVAADVDAVTADMERRLGSHRGGAFLVLHPSLGYVAREFGLRQLAVTRGPSGPGAATLAEIVRTAREAGIRTVLVQPQFSDEAARTVAAELPGGRVRSVDPLARDWPAAMLGITDAIVGSFRPPGAADFAEPAERGRAGGVGSRTGASGR